VIKVKEVHLSSAAPRISQSRRFLSFALLFFLLPLIARTQAVQRHGDTRADDATAALLLRSVVDTAKERGGCDKIEDIRVEPIPADFDPQHKYAGFNLELWTAIGCNKEFPVWVGWPMRPMGNGLVQISGTYKWASEVPR
jgi:hypothetical protein